MKVNGGKILLQYNKKVQNLFDIIYIASYFKKGVLGKYRIEKDALFAKKTTKFINSETELSIELLDPNSKEYENLVNKIYKFDETEKDNDLCSNLLTIENIYKINNNNFDRDYVKGKRFVYGCHASAIPNTLNIMCNNFETNMIGSTTDIGYYGKGIYFHNILSPEYCKYFSINFLKNLDYHIKNKPIAFIIVCKLYYGNYAFQGIPIEINEKDELEQNIQDKKYEDKVRNKLTTHRVIGKQQPEISEFHDRMTTQYLNDDWYNGKINKDSIYFPNKKIDLLVVKRLSQEDDLIKIDNIKCGDNKYEKNINEENNEENNEEKNVKDENTLINKLLDYLELTIPFENIRKQTVLFSDLEDCKSIDDYRYRFKRMVILLCYTQMLLNFKKDYYDKNDKKLPDDIQLSNNNELNAFIEKNMQNYDPNYYVKISQYIDEFILKKTLTIHKRNYDTKCECEIYAYIFKIDDFLIFKVGLYALFGNKGLFFTVDTKYFTLDEFVVNDTKLIEVSYIVELSNKDNVISNPIEQIKDFKEKIKEEVSPDQLYKEQILIK